MLNSYRLLVIFIAILNRRQSCNFFKYISKSLCIGISYIEHDLQTIGESPMADKLPPQMKQRILHATLTKGAMVIMASDMVSEKGLIKGNSVSLMLNCSSEDEIKTLYAQLSKDGEATHLLEDTFWGALFGDLTDKFGNHWLLHFDRNQ